MEKKDLDNIENQDSSDVATSTNLGNQDSSDVATSTILGDQDSSSNITSSTEGPTILQTGGDAKDGQNKCPKCGATDISLNSNNGKLRCNFCRHEFEIETIIPDTEEDLRSLKSEVLGSGVQDIIADVEDVLTFKCSSCGAEVVIDTNEATQASCHWCRNTLSINQQIPNGAIPDMVLPFKLKKDEAKAEIENFTEKRKFFAHPKFKQEFSTQNVMGVYFPYMVVDINGHSKLSGQGEHETRRYTVKVNDKRETRYDAEVYDVEREFDILIDDLTIESSSDRINNKSSDKTNNIINTIMPFDTENSVKWNANYLKGFSSEKRDINIEQLRGILNDQVKDIARHTANSTLTHYDRGVKWTEEQFDIKGQKWIAAYLPVWLCSYQEVKNNEEKLLHYFAVNARTKEMMGSVPIHMPTLLAVSAMIATIAGVFGFFIGLFFEVYIGLIVAAFFAIFAGTTFYQFFHNKYRNQGARHYHEKETKATMENIRKSDIFIKKLTNLRNSRMSGANNTKVSNER